MRLLAVIVLLVSLVPLSAWAEDAPVRLFIGQDLGAVGGLKDYAQGYIDAFGMPDGVTSYTDLKGLGGLFLPADWGAGDICAQRYLSDEKFAKADIAFGVYMVDQCGSIAQGLYGQSIRSLGEFVAAASPRTVYLRLGYEFDGPWNHYAPEEYIKAFCTIVDALRAQGVLNFQTVWQSYGFGSEDDLMRWYPGDTYVDWMGYSYFDGDSTVIGSGILNLARKMNKPVFISEAAPKRDNASEDAQALWSAWYGPFLEHIRTNNDVIKAVSYINCDWESQSMWKGQGWGDSRIQANEELSRMWRDILKDGPFPVK